MMMLHRIGSKGNLIYCMLYILGTIVNIDKKNMHIIIYTQFL